VNVAMYNKESGDGMKLTSKFSLTHPGGGGGLELGSDLEVVQRSRIVSRSIGSLTTSKYVGAMSSVTG